MRLACWKVQLRITVAAEAAVTHGEDDCAVKPASLNVTR